jgi:AcrR family transcriptional regulator
VSKAETISALMDSAITVFAEAGYQGASLRDIASIAQCPLSTINMYFGTKADLFTVVMAKLWRDIETDRQALLASRRAAQGGAADLRDVVYALVKPVVDRARSGTAADRRMPRLLRQWAGAPPEVKSELRRRNRSTAALANWIDCVREQCPGLPRSDVVWGFSFVVGSLYSWEMTDSHYDAIIEMDELTGDQVVDCLVEFAVCGLQGLIVRAQRTEHTAASSGPPAYPPLP